MKTVSLLAAAIAMLGLQAELALAGGGARARAHGTPASPAVHQPGQHAHMSRQPVPHGTPGAGNQAHKFYGGPRIEQRPDPNYQSLYRPMFSLDATNPGETHPYFRTPKEGFGYPAARPAPVYLGNGYYVIPR